MDTIIERRIIAEKDVADKEAALDALRKQIQDAENALADSKIRLSDIIASEKTLPGLIADISTQLGGYRIELERVEAKVAEIQAKIDDLKDNDLTQQISEIESSIMNQRK